MVMLKPCAHLSSASSVSPSCPISFSLVVACLSSSLLSWPPSLAALPLTSASGGGSCLSNAMSVHHHGALVSLMALYVALCLCQYYFWFLSITCHTRIGLASERM